MSLLKWWYSVANDLFLFVLVLVLIYCLYSEFVEQFYKKEEKKKRTLLRKRYRSILASPIYAGCTVRKMVYMDLLALNHYCPVNALVSSADNEITENNINIGSKPIIQEKRKSLVLAASPVRASEHGASINDICAKITFPFMPGCEPDCPAANTLVQKYSELTRPDVVRYLVARKGNQKAAEEMIEKCLLWRKTVFPLRKADVAAAFGTKCFFPYGRARDGSPVVYMRGGLYDANIATPQQYVLAAAYTIDYSLRQFPEEVNVTVIVHTVNIPGGPNQSADTNFIKLFIQVLSDNYPERLKRLAIFPFPWYGRAIWGVLKVFVDKRTQDKVLLLSKGGEKQLPSEILECLDVHQVPDFMGGTCKEPIVDLLQTLQD